MKIQITGDNIDIDTRIRDLVHNKIATNLDKYLETFTEDIKTATLNIHKRTRWGYRASFDMLLPGKEHIFAEATHKKLSSAIVKLREKLERQIKEYKNELKS